MKVTIEIPGSISSQTLIQGLAALEARILSVGGGDSCFLDDHGTKAARDRLSSLLTAGRDSEGIPCIDDDGTLEPWANYVATDENGETAYQYKHRPVPDHEKGMWIKGILTKRDVDDHWLDLVHGAPRHYAITDRHWTETLRRIKR